MDNKFSNIDLQAWKPWIFQGQQAPHQDQGLAMGHLCRTGYLQSAIRGGRGSLGSHPPPDQLLEETRG